MTYNSDEEVPVTGLVDPRGLREDTKYTKDEDEQSTLRRVHKILKDKLTEIDQWHAFADNHQTLSEMKLKQDIHAHQLAYDIVEPCFELVEQALATVDERFRQRNNQ